MSPCSSLLLSSTKFQWGETALSGETFKKLKAEANACARFCPHLAFLVLVVIIVPVVVIVGTIATRASLLALLLPLLALRRKQRLLFRRQHVIHLGHHPRA